jgi:threonyl-tRNA synthetase
MKQEKATIEQQRHSLSHVLAQAVIEMFPEAKLGIGPAIDDGFYYDFDLPRTLIPEDLPLLEEKMRKIIAEDQKFERYEEPVDQSIAFLEKIKQPYKVELAKDLKADGEKQVSFYKNGPFVDMCAGPHVASTKELNPKAFKLTSIAGAYWRGSEKNKMLQRIYAWAFETEKELKEFEQMMEEAKKRDHRELGKKLEIFTFSDEIGAGLPIWLPYGTVLRDVLENLAKRKEFEQGYVRVSTPVITKEALFLKSGHLPHYKESMYSPMDIDGETYYIKPMNCPFHHAVYASKPRSYRELPLRIAEYGMCHRYEKSGELQGLFRVRSMLMNDAHIYVRPDQVREEIKKVIELHEYYYKLFDIKKIKYRLSKHDKKELGHKYVDMPEAWAVNEQILREVMEEMKLDYFEADNEAAFYGPKIDINVYSAIGKEYTIGTVQLDFAQPMRFELKYTDDQGKEIMPYCIHRAPLSVHERFIGFLIEHYAGAFPVWLAPVQVKILPVSDKFNDYANSIAEKIKAMYGRVEVDTASETLGKKIRNAEMMKIPHIVVVGEKEEKEKSVTVRLFSTKEQKVHTVKEYLKELEKLIKLPE